MNRRRTDYDVVVLGGAFSGAAAAIVLRRFLPDARVLVVEKAETFDQKVGEATVEVSSMFLHRVLGLYDELSRTHLAKHGLRFWFSDHGGRRLAEMSESGPDEVPRLPSFQLDRAKLDERLLALAGEEGAEVARPARVTEVRLDGAEPGVRFEQGGREREVTARWVVDATGRAALLARQLGHHVRTDEHPIAAAWGRWSNVADMDGPGILGPDPTRPSLPPISAARRLGTNHFCGYGWWCWVIPLGGGETSIGVVYNKELFELGGSGPAIARYRAFLASQPGLRELVAGARLNEEDFRGYGHLPYRTTAYAGRGWALVGDAASFLDPYYSPGLDHAAMSVYATARLIEADLGGRTSEPELDRLLAKHNEEFVRSYDRWLSAVYLGKYELMGDAELTSTAFVLDIALYYLGVVAPVHADIDNMKNPVLGLGLPQATLAYRFMRFYNDRLVRIARKKRAQGTYGRRNVGRRQFFGDVGLGWSTARRLLKGLGMWGRLEVETLLEGALGPARREGARAPEAMEGRAAERPGKHDADADASRVV